ncbi:U1 zinc finger-domain-containing protein [Clohesyomyces aquaticus]|uniref:U1 small nuclear ribonucleoprotein C n=1 Tax=Clohesyomyces aquaticus TaxID=1231657 RepID=A0A1Y1ZC04_9PLEO|nr:U1 zinc finger-domain-containing protein [Clohesyomyces aquaticus]
MPKYKFALHPLTEILLTCHYSFVGDYCDVYLTHDSMSVRKAHNSGRNHLRNVQQYYEQISSEQAQQVIDSITASYAAEGQQNPLNAPMHPAIGGPGPMPFGAFPPPGMPGMPPMGMPGMPPPQFMGPGGMPPHPQHMPPFPPSMPGGPPGPGGMPPNMPPHMPPFPPPQQGGMPPPFPFPPPHGNAGSPPGGMPFPPPQGMPGRPPAGFPYPGGNGGPGPERY